MLLLWIILFSVLGSVGAVSGAGAFLMLSDKTQNKIISSLVAYAAGALLGAALLGMLPHALESAPINNVLPAVLFGIVLFFVLDKLMIWRHCHERECDVHGVGTSGSLILIGDAFHNLTDGIVIAAGFLSSKFIGITVGLSVITHEISQEVGDFGILLSSGYSKRRALIMNTLSGLTTLPAAVVAFFALEMVSFSVPYILAVSAASFLYISLTGLSPELHREVGMIYTIRQLILMLTGIGTIGLIIQLHP